MLCITFGAADETRTRTLSKEHWILLTPTIFIAHIKYDLWSGTSYDLIH